MHRTPNCLLFICVFLLPLVVNAECYSSKELNAFGESTSRITISNEQFRLSTESKQASSKIPTCTTTIEERYESGLLRKKVISVFERTLDSHSRETVTEFVGDKETGFTVTVEDGDSIYTKIGSGDWMKEIWYFRHPPTDVYAENLNSITYWKESRLLNNLHVLVFGSTSIIERNNGKRYLDIEHYLTKDGTRFNIRTERTIGTPSVLITRISSASKEVPNLKIEAPAK